MAHITYFKKQNDLLIVGHYAEIKPDGRFHRRVKKEIEMISYSKPKMKFLPYDLNNFQLPVEMLTATELLLSC